MEGRGLSRDPAAPYRMAACSQESAETMLSRLEYFRKAPELMQAVPDLNKAVGGSGPVLMQSGCLRARAWPEDEASAIVRE